MSAPSASPTFVLTLIVELALFAFHASVLACICRQRRRGSAAFRAGFFTFYVVQSAADLVDFVFELLFVRLASMDFIPAEVFNYPHGSMIFAVLTYATDVQFMAHAAIAINRFLVLKESWTDRHQRMAVVVILLVPLPSASIRLACGLRLVETGTGGYALVRDARWAVAITIAISSFTTSIVSLVFELSSLVVYKRLTLTARAKYRNDFLLLGRS